MDIKVGGKINATVTEYTVQEEATPLTPGDESGAITQVTASAKDRSTLDFPAKSTVEVFDDLHGEVSGVIRTTESSEGAVSFSVDSRMYALLKERLANAYRGTLGGAFDYYLFLCGITVGTYVQNNIATRPVIFPAWQGEVWVYLKKMCAAEGVEIALVNNVITLRETRLSRISTNKATSLSTQVDVTDMAESLEVYNYNTEYKAKGLVYPAPVTDSETGTEGMAGWNEGAEIVQIPYGETLELEVEISAYLDTIEQPVCVKDVPRYFPPGEEKSVYTITYTGKDKAGDSIVKVVNPTQWNKEGGLVKVEKKPNTLNTLIITISCGTMPRGLAPYTLGITTSEEDQYGSLRIVGSGIFTQKQKITVKTGVAPEDAASVVGETIDNEFINSRTRAYEAIYNSIGKYCGLTLTTSGSVPLVGLEQDQGAFGYTAGARYRSEDAEYRARSADISPEGINFNAECDTLAVDWNEAWGPDATLGDLAAMAGDLTFLDFARTPLRTS